LHVKALDHLIAGGDNLTANCGYGHGFSVLEVIRAAEQVSGRRVNVNMAPRRAGDPAELVADASLIGEKFGWAPRFDDLKTIIRHALAWEKSRADRKVQRSPSTHVETPKTPADLMIRTVNGTTPQPAWTES
jgi:UDP-glucose 4-epimerase